MPVVLIIDDEPQIRELWSDVLNDEGLDVRVASSGAEGVELATLERVDVVVTDMLMPNKDGIETLLEIKTQRPEARVVVVSGGGPAAQTTFLGLAGKLGADATLQKPVDIDRFLETVTRLAGAT